MLNSDRNSVESSDQEMMKHMCKLCDKSFPCGRSLGGHMRSHVISSTDHHLQNKNLNTKIEVDNGSSNSSELGYELRKDPKKTLKAVINGSSNSNEFVVLDKLCKECGKGFQSWKALFGHMKCHSDKVSSNKTAAMNKDSLISHLGNKNLGVKERKMKKSRSKKCLVTCATTPAVTTTTTTDSSSVSMNAHHASTSVVSDNDQEQEVEIAMCLIMLSRDVGKWGKNIIVKDCKVKKLAETEVQFDRVKKSTTHGHDFDDQMKGKFECATCKKCFHSHQALGGHKASHYKKPKDCFDLKLDSNNTIKSDDHMSKGRTRKPSDNHQASSSVNLVGSSKNDTMVVGAHECSICFKSFSSGQALGGHKRSHLIAEAKLNQQNAMLIEKLEKPDQEIRCFLDLNMLPDDPLEDEEQETVMMDTSTTSTGYNPWYYNHESTLLGLLSTT
ncbi:zinc finger, C2H2-like protein [Artemisia annua]|uniref:Zinc finger, C2H2-like protein n=1 Tax=Artemisia annua TaxID=35608 RepID=A0A2U1QM71_ARTAN|nr:zinc finger, C2H2-like protein [Artemisia annua]